MKTGNRRKRNSNEKGYTVLLRHRRDPMFPNFGKAIKKLAKILKEDEDCREGFPEGRFSVAYKPGHKNLKEIIAPSKFAFAS